MGTISITFKDKEYSLAMLWNVIRGYNLLAVVIDNDMELSEIDGPIIQFIANSKPPFNTKFQKADNEVQESLRITIAEAIETQFLKYIRNKFSESIYDENAE